MKEVILLGSGNSAYECPFDAELWATASMLPRIDPDCTKVFAFGNDSQEARDIALREGIPIVSTESYATERFPLDEIISEFGDYFRPAISYMIAYAIYLGYEKIRLYGVDQGDEWHHIYDKHYITFWLGVANGRGVAYEITKASGLYRVMKHNVRAMYEKSRRFKEALKGKDFMDVAMSGNDPYSFVSGIDLSAITVKHYDKDGKVLAQWRHMT